MTWANHSNHSNQSNHSNHSNHSSGGEFGHPGGPSTSLLSTALDDLGITLPPGGVLSGGVVISPSVDAAWRTLNRRHRHELLVSELTRGLSVAGDRNSVTVELDGEALVTINMQGLDADFWAAQLDGVRNMKGLRRERMAEILTQVTDLISFMGLAVPLVGGRNDAVTEALAAVNAAVARIEFAVKFRLSVPRPHLYASNIAPVIQTPAHSAMPSGHAAESRALAVVLAQLFPGAALSLAHIAARISENRVVAGVHFPADGPAGAALGDVLGQLYAHRLLGTAPPEARVHRVADASGLDATSPDLPVLTSPAPVSNEVLALMRAEMAAELAAVGGGGL